MPETTYLGWIVFFLGLAVVFGSNPQTAPRDITLIRLLAGCALILFGLLRLFHIL